MKKRKASFFFFVLAVLVLFFNMVNSFVFNVSIKNNSSNAFENKNYICVQFNNYYNCYLIDHYPYSLTYSNNYLNFYDDEGNKVEFYLTRPLNGSIIYYKKEKNGGITSFDINSRNLNYSSAKINLIKEEYNNSIILLNDNRVSPSLDNNYLSFYFSVPSKITTINLDFFKGGNVFYVKIKSYLNITICKNNSCFYYKDWPFGFFELNGDILINLNDSLLLKIQKPSPMRNYLINFTEFIQNKSSFKRIILNYSINFGNLTLLTKKLENLSFSAELNERKLDYTTSNLNGIDYYLIQLENEKILNNLKLVYYKPLNIEILKKDLEINVSDTPSIKESYDGSNLEIEDSIDNLIFKAQNCDFLSKDLKLSLFYVDKNNSLMVINASPLEGFNCSKYSLIVPLNTLKVGNITKFNGSESVNWKDYYIFGNYLVINFYERDPVFTITLTENDESKVEASFLILNSFITQLIIILLFVAFLIK